MDDNILKAINLLYNQNLTEDQMIILKQIINYQIKKVRLFFKLRCESLDKHDEQYRYCELLEELYSKNKNFIRDKS